MKTFKFGMIALAMSFSAFAQAEQDEIYSQVLSDQEVMDENLNGEPLMAPETLESIMDQQGYSTEEYVPYGRFNSVVRCYASDRRGRVYAAEGNPRRVRNAVVQQRAMRQCQYSSRFPRSCRPNGCRVIR